MRHKNTYNDLCYVTFYNKFVNCCLYPWIKEQSVNGEMMTIHREDCFYLLDSVWWYLNSTKFQSLCQFSTQTYCIGYALGPHIVWLWSVGDKELSKFQYIQALLILYVLIKTTFLPYLTCDTSLNIHRKYDFNTINIFKFPLPSQFLLYIIIDLLQLFDP